MNEEANQKKGSDFFPLFGVLTLFSAIMIFILFLLVAAAMFFYFLYKWD